MKRCSKCNSLMPSDVTRCIRCGNEDRPSASPGKASTIAPAASQPENTIAQAGDSRKLKYWGLGLTAIGAFSQFLPISYQMPALLLIAILVCTIGLACYARSLKRSVMWGAFGLWPLVGAFLGLAFLAAAKRRKTDPSAAKAAAKTMSKAQLKWGWIGYVLVLSFLPAQVYLNDGLACVYLPDARFPPLAAVEGSGCGFASFLTLFLAFVAALVALHGSAKALRGFGLRASAPWLALRLITVAIAFVYAFRSIEVSEVASQMVEVQTSRALAALQPGMPKEAVESVILKANASFVPPVGGAQESGREHAEYQKVRDALALAKTGKSARFDTLHFHRAFFNVNMDSLDRIAAPRTTGSESLYVRSCCQVMFRWTRYDLFVDYDADNHLKSARYSRSSHEDGQDQDCSVLFELPPGGKKYPYPCPAEGTGKTTLSRTSPA